MLLGSSGAVTLTSASVEFHVVSTSTWSSVIVQLEVIDDVKLVRDDVELPVVDDVKLDDSATSSMKS